jgi:hypothetical protein
VSNSYSNRDANTKSDVHPNADGNGNINADTNSHPPRSNKPYGWGSVIKPDQPVLDGQFEQRDRV